MEHPDISYLKKDDISKVLMKGLAQTYKKKPGNPVDFFAKWLLNYEHINSIANIENQRKDEVQKRKDEYVKRIDAD